ncbi:phosphorylase [Pantanalinema rosaneae CENA516]|uniref:phosphorylase family protein n=1 Tax=Pantanalinema rosaneae TaxID=1620701 RepID=UPI003D6F78E2
MPNLPVILVPQGAEYQAVCRGLKAAAMTAVTVLPIPACPAPVMRHLQALVQSGQLTADRPVVVVGLCGSLTPTLTVGDVVLYRDCLAGDAATLTQRSLDAALSDRYFRPNMIQVRGYTSDRVICLPAAKQQLGQQYGAEVVDMEGAAILQVLPPAGIAVVMIRVVSDDCHHDLPNLAGVYDANGSLRSGVMAVKMIQQPIASWYLIRGALRGLAVLQTTIAQLFAA